MKAPRFSRHQRSIKTLYEPSALKRKKVVFLLTVLCFRSNRVRPDLRGELLRHLRQIVQIRAFFEETPDLRMWPIAEVQMHGSGMLVQVQEEGQPSGPHAQLPFEAGLQAGDQRGAVHQLTEIFLTLSGHVL